jgi:hypothetical protein
MYRKLMHAFTGGLVKLRQEIGAEAAGASEGRFLGFQLMAQANRLKSNDER